jgi:hypothetical protein
MNERIRELAIEAKLIASEYNGFDHTRLSISQQKFAELIVRECADICLEMAAKCAGLPGDGALAKDCANWIKKDFGVEE